MSAAVLPWPPPVPAPIAAALALLRAAGTGRRVPVPLAACCAAAGVLLTPDPPPGRGLAGACLVGLDGPRLAVAADPATPDGRWLVAHLLGHVVLHHAALTGWIDDAAQVEATLAGAADPPAEAAATAFAAALLVPGFVVRAARRRRGSVPVVARRLAVPPALVDFRWRAAPMFRRDADGSDPF